MVSRPSTSECCCASLLEGFVRFGRIVEADGWSSGLVGIGGFINKPLPEEVVKDKSMVFTFGRNGFFGYSSVGPAETNNMMW